MSIYRSLKKLLIPLVIAALLPGCATKPDGTPMSDQEQTAAEGAVAGALVGALIGLAIGSNRKVAKSLAGAAIGGLAGYAIGTSIAERKAQYASNEDFLVAEIRRNQDFIQEADAQNNQLYAEILRLDQESQQLAQEYRAGQISRDALAEKQVSMEKQLAQAKQVNALVDKQLADATEVHRESQQTRGSDDQYTQQLETSLVQLKATREQADRNVVTLQRIYDNMSI